MDLKERLHVYLDANINKFAKNRSGPWKNLASDAPPEMCVALSVKVQIFYHSDNKSDDKFEFEVRSDGIRLLNLSKYMNNHEAFGPSDFHHASVARGGEIKWSLQTQNNASPGLPQSEGHSGYTMSHLSCLDDNVTLLVPHTKPQEVVLGSPETKLSTLVSTMREEKCSETLIKDTRSAFIILSRLKSTTDPDAMDEL